MVSAVDFPTVVTERGEVIVEAVYISGPMTGRPEYVQVFRDAAEDLTGRGFKVYSPVELDEEDGVQDVEATLVTRGYPPQYFSFLERDMALISSGAVDAGVFLPEWQRSRGASAEYRWFHDLALPTLSYPALEVLEYRPAGRRP